MPTHVPHPWHLFPRRGNPLWLPWGGAAHAEAPFKHAPSPSRGMSGGRPTPCQPVASLHTQPPPDSPVIPMPREESGTRGSVPLSTELEADVGATHPRLPLFFIPIPLSLKGQGGEGSPVGLETRTRGRGPLCLCFFSPSPLKALRERGIKGVRVPLEGPGGYSPQNVTLPLDMQTFELYICSKSRPDTNLKEESKTQGNNPGARKDSTP